MTRRNPWSKPSTTPGELGPSWVEVTHPFHPLRGQRFAFLTRKKTWGEDRVTFQDSKGRFHSIPTSWTDLRPVDPFVVMAAGRALFRPVDLLAVVALAGGVGKWPAHV
jgi:hypothetical protein